MKFIKKLIDYITWPYRRWKSERAWKKKLKELRQRDPFIYK